MAKKCPKCGAQFSGLVNGHQIYWCGSEQVDKAFTQTVKCFETQLATVEAERDSLKAKLARIKEVRPAIIPCVTHDDAGAACCAAMGILDRVLSDTPKEVGDD